MIENNICFQGKHGGEPMLSIFAAFLCDKISDKKQLKGGEVHFSSWCEESVTPAKTCGQLCGSGGYDSHSLTFQRTRRRMGYTPHP